MKSIKFNYYQHSYISETPEIPISANLSFKEIEINYTPERGGYFASYITEFDCTEETNWWFTIKDNDYDLSKLKSNDRRKIILGRRYCKMSA